MIKKSVCTAFAVLICATTCYAASPYYPDSYPSTQPSYQPLLSDKHFNVTWNTLSSVVGFLSGNINYRLNKASAIGLFGGYLLWDNEGLRTYDVGVQYSYALNHNYGSSGWLVKPFLGYTHWNSDMIFSLRKTEIETGFMVGTMLSYQWVWSSGFNLQLGAGPLYISIRSSSFEDQGTLPSFEFNLGFMF